MKQIIKTYGPYRLELNYHDNDFCQVSMKNVGEKWPLIWSTGLTKAQANGAIKLFGYVNFSVFK